MAKFTKRPVQHTNRIIPAAPPFKGLNDTQPIGAMAPEFAIIFDNLIAKPNGPTSRLGSRKHYTGFAAAVKSFIRYNGKVPADSKFFAVSGGNIFDITATGEVGDDPALVTGLSTSNVWWQFAQQTHTTATHNYVIAVNGANMPQLYNGAWSAATQTGSPSAAGEFKDVDNNGAAVDISKFKDVALHQQRLWFVLNNSSKGYYCDIAQVGGNLYAFDFGPFFPRGGNLHKITAWTLDAGGDSGVQAILIAISSNGDVVVFDGNNPADAGSWQYRGSYQLGSPVGQRCTEAFQGELLYLSKDGLFPLSKYLRSAGTDPTQALTYNISNSISSLVNTFTNLEGFEVKSFAPQSALVLNIPQQDSKLNFQYVMNTLTGGWGRFTGWAAHCFMEFNGQFYYGTDNAVVTAFSNFTDNADTDGTNGTAVVWRALQAFTDLSEADLGGAGKTVNGIKPYIETTNPTLSLAVGINVDFDTSLGSVTGVTLPTSSLALWDSATWDGATWYGGTTTFNQWFVPLSNPGINIAVALVGSGNSQVTWAKTDWRLVAGLENG